jgi:hypothetical protein
MATYYIRQSGSDSNNGTSAATAWRTLGKALGAAGISSGDTAYIGAGTYRETVTVGMTSATAETKIIGDVTGEYTGDAGEVIWSAYTNGDFASPAATGCCLLNGRDYLTFENLTIIGSSSANYQGIDGSVQTSTNITLRNCTFFQTKSGTAFSMNRADSAWNVPFNWLITGCRFFGYSFIAFNPASSATGADYDMNVVIEKSVFIGISTGEIISTGPASTNTYKPGGFVINNCFFTGGPLIRTYNYSTAIPAVVKNCSGIYNGSALFANSTGTILDGGRNRFMPIGSSGTALNVTTDTTSRYGAFPNMYPIELGQSAVLGLPYRHPLMPYAASGTYPGGALGFGNVAGGTSTSITGRTRPAGIGILGDVGTATAGTSTTLSDSGKAWGANQYTGWLVRITSGTGSGQVKRIDTNTGTQLVISGSAPAGGQWATTPSTDSTYIIYQGPQVETGKATSGGATTLTDSNANWATNQWGGYTLEITGGTGSGQTATVSSNTATALTVPTWATNPDNTSTYALYWPGSSLTATQPSAGAFEQGDTARAETTVTDSGTGARIDGPGSQDLTIPVDATATTVTVRARYDSNHGTGSKPQLQLLAQPEIGVSAATATMTSNADTWETLTVGPFTPTAAGVVTIRLVSRSATPYGLAYFDTIGVT